MINFRFHIVSLVAVFLALAVGVVVGTAVIDSATVDLLQAQQRALREDVEAVRAENAQLRVELDQRRAVGEQLEDQAGVLVEGRLSGVPVLTVADRGADEAAVDGYRDLLASAGATDQGVVWLTDRLHLEDEADVVELASTLGLAVTTPPETMRAAVASRVAGALRTGTLGVSALAGTSRSGRPLGEPVGDLVDAGFLDFSPPDGGNDDVPAMAPSSRVVVVAAGPPPEGEGDGAGVPDGEAGETEEAGTTAELALRLVVALADDPALPLLAAETAVPLGGDAGALVGTVRDDPALSERVATVDALADPLGQVAAVYALRDLGTGQVGHYGYASGAAMLLPSGRS